MKKGDVVTIKCPRTPTLDGRRGKVVRFSPGYDVTPWSVTVQVRMLAGNRIFSFSEDEVVIWNPNE